MPEAFVPLARYFGVSLGQLPSDGNLDAFNALQQSLVDKGAISPIIEDPVAENIGEDLAHSDDAVAAAISEAKRFHAALNDALDACLDKLLRDIASEVLCRELLLAPCDIGAAVRNALHRIAGEESVAIEAHRDEAPELARSMSLPITVGETLRRGDVRVRVRDGTIDVSLGARLHAVLDRHYR